MNLSEINKKPMSDRRAIVTGVLVVMFLSSSLAEGMDVTLDIPMTMIVGDFTFGGEEITSSILDYGNIYLRNPHAGDNVFLGRTLEQQYQASVIPGEYEIYYEAVNTTFLPENQNLRLGQIVVPFPAGPNARASVFDIDVPLPTTFSGELTVGGQVPPDSAVEWGRVLLRNRVTEDEVPLGATSDGQYSSRIAPGSYDVHYRNVQNVANIVPVNGDAIIGTLHVPRRRGGSARSGQHLDIDIPTTSLTGEVLINGVAGPDSAVAWGNIFLEDQRTGDKIHLTNTRGADFETTLVPGEYNVLYEMVESATGFVPANEHAQFDRLQLGSETTSLGSITLGVPEPSSFVLACVGLLGILGTCRTTR